MIKAVIYARYSSSSQTEQSIEGQIRTCTEYAKAKGLTIVGEYIDRAISGRTDNRPDFQRLIADCRKKLFDAVIVYKTDRFARNKYDSAIYKRELKRSGVELHYAAEAIPDGPEGIILESLMEGLAEYYSAELSQKIRRGMRESALKGHCTGGGLALGYRIGPDKSFILEPTEAKAVQIIFEMFNKGISNAEICKYLNDLGLRTSRGNLFTDSSIPRTVKNEKYVGVYRCGEVHKEGGVPAIVSKEAFYTAQMQLEKRRTSKQVKTSKAEYLLSEKLFCGHCKKKMVGVSGTGKSGGKFYYYYCGSARRKKGCNKKQVPRDWLENLVVSETLKYILQPEVIKYLSNRLSEIQAADKSRDSELVFYQRKIAENKKAIDNMLKAIESGVSTATLPARLRELEMEGFQLAKEYERAQAHFMILTPEQIEFMLLQHAAPQKDEHAYKKQIIDRFVSSVYLYDDRLLIYYNMRGGETELAKSDLADLEKEAFSKFEQKDYASTIKKSGKPLWFAGFFCLRFQDTCSRIG